MPAPASFHIALLRAINVGGNNKLPMADLVDIFKRAGCKDVQHYIQSGNVVYRAADSLAERIPDMVASEILRRFKLKVPVVVRTAESLAQVLVSNPYLAEHVDTDRLYVVFLRDQPEQSAVEALDPNRSPPERFTVVGREIYLACPKGIGNSKLTNVWFDSSLRTTSTVRNWRTVLKLAEMCGAGA